MGKYKVGDSVVVKDPGASYPKYDLFFAKNGIAADVAARYKYGSLMSNSVKCGAKMMVVATGKHEDGRGLLVVQQDEHNDACWLIDEDGVKPALTQFKIQVSFPVTVEAETWDEAACAIFKRIKGSFGDDSTTGAVLRGADGGICYEESRN